MNIEFDAYKGKLNDIRPALDGLADSLNLVGLKNELERLQAMQEAPGFWDNPEKSQKIVVQAKQTETKIEKYEAMCASWDDLMTICEMAAEEDDDSMLPELKEGERVYFACDDVEGEKSAAVTVNGAYAGGFIGKPYRLDITKSVKSGANTLETKPFRLKNPA